MQKTAQKSLIYSKSLRSLRSAAQTVVINSPYRAGVESFYFRFFSISFLVLFLKSLKVAERIDQSRIGITIGS